MYPDLLPADFWFLLRLVPVTLGITGGSMVLGSLLGIPLAALSLSRFRGLRSMAHGYLLLFRNTPVLMQLFFAFFGLPLLRVNVTALAAAMTVLTLNTAGFMSEIYVAGVRSVHAHQIEAAVSLALTTLERLRHVVLPQAVRVMIPPSVGYLTTLVKNSALASTIGFLEIARAGRMITERTGEGFVVFGFVGVLYFLICYPFTVLSRRLERRAR